MAYKRNEQIAVNARTVRLSGSFTLGSSGAIASQYGDGMTFSNETNTGVWGITFKDYYPTVISATASVRCVDSTAKNQIAQLGTFSAANKTLVLRGYADGSASDFAANDTINVNIELSCSTL